MATAISFGIGMDGIAPVFAAQPRATESVTPSGTSAQSTITARPKEICTVSSSVSIWVNIGDNPTAAAGSGYLLQAGETRAFGHLQDGWEVAYITA